jgi:hypothetical protein
MSTIKKWWNELGGGQLILPVVALILFFIIVNEDNISTISIIAFSVGSVALVINLVIYNPGIFYFSAAGTGLIIIFFIDPYLHDTALIAATFAFATFACVTAGVLFNFQVLNIERRTIILSSIGQFCIIFLPILGRVLHWW